MPGKPPDTIVHQEAPLNAEVTLDTEHESAEDSASKLLTLLEERQLIPAAQPA